MRKNNMQTYLMIGEYIDLAHYALKFEKPRILREQIGKKLKIRWEKGIDRDAFEQYFSDHNITKKDLDL